MYVYFFTNPASTSVPSNIETWYRYSLHITSIRKPDAEEMSLVDRDNH